MYRQPRQHRRKCVLFHAGFAVENFTKASFMRRTLIILRQHHNSKNNTDNSRIKTDNSQTTSGNSKTATDDSENYNRKLRNSQIDNSQKFSPEEYLSTFCVSACASGIDPFPFDLPFSRNSRGDFHKRLGSGAFLRRCKKSHCLVDNSSPSHKPRAVIS